MKTLPISAVSIFCEDIREEANGGETFIGVLPDGITVPALPGVLHRLTMHTRITFPPSKPPKEIFSRLIIEGTDEPVFESEVESSIIRQASTETRDFGTPLATVISRVVMGDIPIPDKCRLVSLLKIDGVEYVIGSLRIETPKN